MSVYVVFGSNVAALPYELWPVLLTVGVCWWRWRRR
jgi:hypothetical protein